MAKTSIQIREMIKQKVETVIDALYNADHKEGMRVRVTIDKPADTKRGDYSTNVALTGAKILGCTPIECALAITSKLNESMSAADASYDSQFAECVDKVEMAGAGFINFYIKIGVLEAVVNEAGNNTAFGKIDINAGKKVAYEYTDPNPFKVFHIGHLMSNTIGESLSRLGEFSGAEIKRFCYQGDLGRHVALFIYGLRLMDKSFPTEKEGEAMSLIDRMYFMGTSYARGATYFKEHPEIEEEVQLINKKLYERSDEEVNTIYDLGREWSLQYFETLYALLGTKFDQYFFESKCVEPGMALINEGLAKGIFTKSQDAIVFEGEKYSDESKGEHLHTRVFVTKVGLPTYDAKELGLAKLKYQAFPYDRSITMTGNEQDQYFQVNLKAQSLMIPEIAGKSIHISHGMMVLPTGKMSSRTGDVVSGQEVVDMVKDSVLEIMKDRDMAAEDKTKVAYQIAIAGIKYLVLRQSTGKNVVYEAKKALSFEGDSGPYLQYACVRAKAIISKAKEQGIEPGVFSIGLDSADTLEGASEIMRKIFTFPEIIERAYYENAPHMVATYLIELAGMFNAFYANNQIIDTKDDSSKKRSINLVALTKAIANTLTNGLYVLGIEVPNKM